MGGQINTLTIGGGVQAADLYTVTINGRAVSYSAQTGDTVSSVVQGLVRAINDLGGAGVTGDPTVAGTVTAQAATGSTLTITGDAVGIPFSIATSALNGRTLQLITYNYVEAGASIRPGDALTVTYEGTLTSTVIADSDPSDPGNLDPFAARAALSASLDAAPFTYGHFSQIMDLSILSFNDPQILERTTLLLAGPPPFTLQLGYDLGNDGTVDGYAVITESQTLHAPDTDDQTLTSVLTEAASYPEDPAVTVVRQAGGDGTMTATISNDTGAARGTTLVADGGAGGGITASVIPAGASLGASGSTAAGGSAATATSFVAALRALDPSGVARMVGAAQGFFDGDAASAFVYQRVSPVAAGVAGDPFVFTGTAGGARESLILDTSGLAPGNVVQIDDIEIVAVSGPAHVTGGAGSNRLTASDDVQTLSMGVGDDTVLAGGGNDTAYGNEGVDLMLGNAGDDMLFGGKESDQAWGGQDDDAVFGNLGDDVLFGNLGADLLFGGQGDDALYGGQQDDTLAGNLGDDTLAGGLGADVFSFGSGDGADTIADFTVGEDHVRLEAGLNGTAIAGAEDVLARISADAAGNAVVDLGDGNTITLAGVDPARLGADSFLVL